MSTIEGLLENRARLDTVNEPVYGVCLATDAERFEHLAVLVAQQLELDVPRPRQVFLNVDGGVVEGGRGLVLRHGEHGRETRLLARHPHALADGTLGDVEHIATPQRLAPAQNQDQRGVFRNLIDDLAALLVVQIGRRHQIRGARPAVHAP